MADIFNDLKRAFKQGNIVVRLIYINVAVYILGVLLMVVLGLFNISINNLLQYLYLPADLLQILRRPWAPFTYMFMHAGIWHLFGNMLWLYWFGQLFLYNFSAKHLRGLYLFGGIVGGLFYLLAYNLFPLFQPMVGHSMLLGASASVLAIVVASAVSMPEYRLNLLLFGAVRLKYVALIVVLTDLLFITSENAGGHIAHLGGALAGWWFVRGIHSGKYDATAWINRVLDTIVGWFHRSPNPKKPRMKVHVGKHG